MSADPCSHQYWDLGHCIDCYKTQNEIDAERRAPVAPDDTPTPLQKENEDPLSRVDRWGFSDLGDLPRRATSLCACVSEDAERCIALRYPEAPDLTDDGVIERCECFCHDFGSAP